MDEIELPNGRFWRQAAVIVFVVGLLFWVGVNYNKLMVVSAELALTNERQRDVRERLATVEAQLKAMMKQIENFDRSQERYIDSSRVPNP